MIMETKGERIKATFGGKGYLTTKKLLSEKELDGKCKLYSEITLEPNSNVGYHEHHGESETYYVLSGEGSFNDNGNIIPVKAGDVMHTPSGTGHGIENVGNENLVFMALIIVN